MEVIAVFDTHPGLFIGSLAVLGLLVGSFLNVVVLRLPMMMEREWKSECRALLDLAGGTDEPPFDLVRPRSRCPACEQLITARDNVPVVSWLLLGGRCRHCRTPISARYPLVEVAAGLAGGYAAWHFGPAQGALGGAGIAAALAAAGFCWALIALALIDLDTQLLPDGITLPLLWAGLLLAYFELFSSGLEASVAGAMAGYLSLWSVYWLFKLVTGKEGMGYGDFKLLGALGAWMGWQALPAVILLSSGIGAVIGVLMISTGVIKRTEPIPFGPYLALAGIVALFWGDALQGLFGGAAGL